MKLYRTEPDMCANAGGSCGAIDPKTFRKWLWPFLDALIDLQYKVVSIFCLHWTWFLFVLLMLPLCLRFYLRRDLRMIMAVTAFLVLMVRISKSQIMAGNITLTSSRAVVCGMRWDFRFRKEISAGYLVRSNVDNLMIWWFFGWVWKKSWEEEKKL